MIVLHLMVLQRKYTNPDGDERDELVPQRFSRTQLIMTGHRVYTSGSLRRAPRFAIHARVLYRETGQTNWCEGKIENISRSGLLFRADHYLAPKTSIEIRFVLPVEISSEAAAEVICRGAIVRAVPPANGQPSYVLAATIADYCFVRTEVSRSK